ncbi:MAG: glycosyltransferase family 4 protein [Terracidiphilus sp.]
MRILLLSQVFYPDVVAVAQYVTDLGCGLSAAGHEVTVLCSSRGYDNSAHRFPRREIWNGIRIRRVPVWNLGKKSKLRRIVSAASFFISSFSALMLSPRQHVVVVVPPPPLLSVMAAIFVRIRGGRLLYWNMDLNPDEAIAAGWMKPDSLAARVLGTALRFSLRASSSIVVLDRFMKDRILAKNVSKDKVRVIPVWSHDHAICYDSVGREAFRKSLGIQQQFVVMYSGNHSPLHPLDTILKAALRLRDNPRFVFVFVGGGSEFPRVKEFAQNLGLSNILCVPYQPLELLPASLSAADLQVVTLGDSFVGIVHPCKIYNMLAVGAPFLYVGPAESHITDLRQFPGIAGMGRFVRHGDVDRAVEVITQLASELESGVCSRPGRPGELDHYSQEQLMPSLIELIEATGNTR